mgnify:FL=1
MRGDQLPIEPLDEASWRRIEEGVMADLPLVIAPTAPPAPGWRWVGALALAVACVALGVTLWPREEAPAIATTRVVTDESATVVRLGDATLEIGARSTVVAAGSESGGWEIILSRGVVECSARKVGPKV